ncbi:MAG: MBOAT family protein, partial [Clostridia bacterium]
MTGFWHGAEWNFIFWGIYFGIILVIEKLFLLKFIEKIPKILSHIYAILIIIFGWVLFDFVNLSDMS